MKNKIDNIGKIFTGVVASDKMTNTIVISLAYTYRHPLYHKIVRKHKRIYAENNLNAKIGDTVKVKETRPLSKLKRFTTLEILKKSSN
ncbi:30S ribosomal protein S17 [Candidatus Shapirobacteria bacterium]|jgi:small subunit ribosomal protein S17|nr:30S ribosomal protein S17 [Candidatus Shapirobacteria bacterium]HQI13294.1 30S ribosomal protein S17 [Candidatus Woesebacteria bacterium]